MVSAALPPRPCRCKGRPFPGRRVSSRKSQAPQRRQQEGEPDPEQSPGPVWRGGRSLAGPRPCSHTNTQTHTEGETPRSLPAFEQIPSSLDSLWTGLTAVHNGWTADQRGHNQTLAKGRIWLSYTGSNPKDCGSFKKYFLFMTGTTIAKDVIGFYGSASLPLSLMIEANS